MEDLYREYSILGAYNDLGPRTNDGVDYLRGTTTPATATAAATTTSTSTTPATKTATTATATSSPNDTQHPASNREEITRNGEIMDVVCSIFSAIQNMETRVSKQLGTIDQRLVAIEEKLSNTRIRSTTTTKTAAVVQNTKLGKNSTATAGTAAGRISNGFVLSEEELFAIRPEDSFEEVCAKLSRRGWTINAERKLYLQPSFGLHDMAAHKHLIGDKFFLGEPMFLNYLKKTFQWTPPPRTRIGYTATPVPALVPIWRGNQPTSQSIPTQPNIAVNNSTAGRASSLDSSASKATQNMIRRVSTFPTTVGEDFDWRKILEEAKKNSAAPEPKPTAAAPKQTQPDRVLFRFVVENSDSGKSHEVKPLIKPQSQPHPQPKPKPEAKTTTAQKRKQQVPAAAATDGEGGSDAAASPDHALSRPKKMRLATFETQQFNQIEFNSYQEKAFYCFEKLMPKLEKLGWKYQKGRRREDWVYVLPGGKGEMEGGEHNVDFFYTWWKVVDKCRSWKYYERRQALGLVWADPSKIQPMRQRPQRKSSRVGAAGVGLDIAEERTFYTFSNLMPQLKTRLGWGYVQGSSKNRWNHVLPGRKDETEGGKEGLDYFLTWQEVVRHCKLKDYYQRRDELGLTVARDEWMADTPPTTTSGG